MTHGGKREGAGGKAGSIRPKLTHYWSQEDIVDYFDWLKEAYKENPVLAKMVGEQIMGKAPQPIANDEDKPFLVSEVSSLSDEQLQEILKGRSKEGTSS